MDFIAKPLGQFLHFIYNTVAFENYGLAIIIFTILVKLALLPLTLKQYKSTAKMQELQPIINDVQKRYKDDKEKLNQEMMKVYQEHNYNPASGCLPLLIQFPILITLYWVIIQPLKFLLGKTPDQISKIVEVAQKGLNLTTQALGNQKEIIALNFFNDNRDALSQVTGILDQSELINFNNFLGLRLGEVAKYQPSYLFGEQAHIYLPLFILVILATVTTFISTKISMPKNNQNGNGTQNAAANSMSNSMMYVGPIMTLMFSFSIPAGVILYWMVGYVFTIFQQLYINKYILKRNNKPEQNTIQDNKKNGVDKLPQAGEAAAEGNQGAGGANNKDAGNKAGSGKNSNAKKKGKKKK